MPARTSFLLHHWSRSGVRIDENASFGLRQFAPQRGEMVKLPVETGPLCTISAVFDLQIAMSHSAFLVMQCRRGCADYASRKISHQGSLGISALLSIAGGSIARICDDVQQLERPFSSLPLDNNLAICSRANCRGSKSSKGIATVSLKRCNMSRSFVTPSSLPVLLQPRKERVHSHRYPLVSRFPKDLSKREEVMQSITSVSESSNGVKHIRNTCT